jgi:hypothetical protein
MYFAQPLRTYKCSVRVSTMQIFTPQATAGHVFSSEKYLWNNNRKTFCEDLLVRVVSNGRWTQCFCRCALSRNVQLQIYIITTTPHNLIPFLPTFPLHPLRRFSPACQFPSSYFTPIHEPPLSISEVPGETIGFTGPNFMWSCSASASTAGRSERPLSVAARHR